jgi:hypothetical protein
MYGVECGVLKQDHTVYTLFYCPVGDTYFSVAYVNTYNIAYPIAFTPFHPFIADINADNKSRLIHAVYEYTNIYIQVLQVS